MVPKPLRKRPPSRRHLAPRYHHDRNPAATSIYATPTTRREGHKPPRASSQRRPLSSAKRAEKHKHDRYDAICAAGNGVSRLSFRARDETTGGHGASTATACFLCAKQLHDSGLPADVLVSKLKKDILFALRRGTIARVTTALDAAQRAVEDERDELGSLDSLLHFLLPSTMTLRPVPTYYAYHLSLPALLLPSRRHQRRLTFLLSSYSFLSLSSYQALYLLSLSGKKEATGHSCCCGAAAAAAAAGSWKPWPCCADEVPPATDAETRNESSHSSSVAGNRTSSIRKGSRYQRKSWP